MIYLDGELYTIVADDNKNEYNFRQYLHNSFHNLRSISKYLKNTKYNNSQENNK